MSWKMLLGAAAIAAAMALVTACGSSKKTSTSGTTVAGSSSSYGSPGVASAADRTIDVAILPSLMYDPASITVSPGETVTFKVTNQTSGIHEFVLGDTSVQNSYESEMMAMGSSPMTMADRSNLLNEQAGVTKELTWHFPSTLGATVIFGSHEPNDYTHGLRGLITVGTATAGSSTTEGMSGMTSTTEGMSGMTTTTEGMGGMTTTTEGMGGMSGMTTTTAASNGM